MMRAIPLSGQAFGEIIQHGFVVADAERAACDWAERVGAGPFTLIDSLVLGDCRYRGARAETELRIAIGFWGCTQIELIQPLRDEGLYRQALMEAPGNLHHYGLYVQELDALLDERRWRDQIVQSGEMPNGLRFVYLEGLIPGGLYLELIQPTPDTVTGLELARALSRDWDGAQPVR